MVNDDCSVSFGVDWGEEMNSISRPSVNVRHNLWCQVKWQCHVLSSEKKKTFSKGGTYEMKFNYLFQGELNLFTIRQSCFPGLHAALSFNIVMLSGMISNGFTKSV